MAASRPGPKKSSLTFRTSWHVIGKRPPGLVIQRIVGGQGEAARKYVQRGQLRLSSTYRLPQLEQMKLGASMSYQGNPL